MKMWILTMTLVINPLGASEVLKKAFAEGIKSSIEVVKYEKSQAFKAVPEGYCVTLMGKDAPLDMWEEVKLESLALFLDLSPSLLASKKAQGTEKKVLCLSISKEKQDAMESLKKIRKNYPKIDNYISKVEILPSNVMYRIIPGVGKYFKDKSDEIEALKYKTSPDKPLSERIVFLGEKKKAKTFFDNGSTRVLGSALKNVLYVEHTIYKRRSE